MLTQTIQITGMTCSSCVAKVKSVLGGIPGIDDVQIHLLEGTAKWNAPIFIPLDKIQTAFKGEPKYIIEDFVLDKENQNKIGFLQTYKPLIIIFLFLILTSGISAFENENPIKMFLHYFMVGFFLVFSFFKLLNIKGFVSSFKMYDIGAKNIPMYGYVYPFLEAGIGLLLLSGYKTFEINVFSGLLMAFGAIGIIISRFKKQQIKCACLGDIFNLPMSNVSLIENVTMIVMSIIMIVY